MPLKWTVLEDRIHRKTIVLWWLVKNIWHEQVGLWNCLLIKLIIGFSRFVCNTQWFWFLDDCFSPLSTFFHINRQPDLGWMRRLQQILGRKQRQNLHVCMQHFCFLTCISVCLYNLCSDLSIWYVQAIYVLHPTLGLKLTVFALQLLVDSVVCYESDLLTDINLFKNIIYMLLTLMINF